MREYKNYRGTLKVGGVSLLAIMATMGTAQAASLFESQGPINADSRSHITSSQNVRINRGALNQARLDFNLDGQPVTAIRSNQVRGEKGNMTWIGHLQGNPSETVIVTARGNVYSGVIQSAKGAYEISGTQNGIQSLEKIDLAGLPQEDIGMSFDTLNNSSAVPTSSASIQNEPVQQDIMVVYTQDACDAAANVSSSDCSQLEADIVTTFAQMNQAYVDSDINIFSNLTSMRLLNYTETSSLPLTALRLTSDGIMDEVHAWREEDGADLVHMVQNNSGCGVAYTNIDASLGFAVTAEACMLGNRTFAHETGHNQNALHDRMQHSGGEIGGYRYGFRRCADGGSEDVGAPYFRTVMAYSCAGTPRVGVFSNPNRNYLGVPQGIDPDVDSANGAYNARRINETALAVSAYREGTTNPPTPPAAPTSLGAIANGSDAINLSWADNADDENGFAIERSTDNVSFAEVATVSSNVTSFSDNGLSAETTYYYRVEANNGAGSSGFSNTASATTESVPTTIDQFAQSQTSSNGTVSGTFSDTHTNNGVVQTITEVGTGGPKRRRQQSYSQTYSFNVLGGAGGVVMTANAYVSGSEGANFEFSSDGGSTWTLMFTVNSNDSENMQSFVFPGGTSGAVLIRVTDAAKTNGEAVDSVSIDSMVITSNTEAGAPPAGPSALVVSGVTSSSVSLSYNDNSSDEFGFEVWRGTAPGVCGTTMVGTASADITSFTDNSAASATTYYYDVSAFNGGGSSGCAGEVSVTTGAAPAIASSGNGYKVKGSQTVDVSWSGANGTNVDVYRDAVVISTVNDGAYTDNIGTKGGGSYVYKVCEDGSTSACSPEFTITF